MGANRHATKLDGGPLSGWVIAIVHGQTLIGVPKRAHPMMLLKQSDDGEQESEKLDDGPVVSLSPVFGLQVQPVQGPNGEQAIVFQAIPILLIPSIDEFDLEGCCPAIFPVDEMTASERKRLQGAVQQGEELQRRLRSADAGITLAHALPKAMPRAPGARG